jgi:hypothetical protein
MAISTLEDELVARFSTVHCLETPFSAHCQGVELSDLNLERSVIEWGAYSLLTACSNLSSHVSFQKGCCKRGSRPGSWEASTDPDVLRRLCTAIGGTFTNCAHKEVHDFQNKTGADCSRYHPWVSWFQYHRTGCCQTWDGSKRLGCIVLWGRKPLGHQ